MKIFGYIRLLPVLLIVCLLAFSVRFADVVTQVKTFEQAASLSAVAADETEEEAVTESQVDVPEGLPENESIPLPTDDWADPDVIDMQFSDTQSSILRELTERRKELDVRENRLNQKEALLTVTEQKIEEKTVELKALRSELEDLLGKQSEEENARYESLVKMYEGMKPKDASAIFNQLDMDVLLEIISRMSERKSAPIIAMMDTKKAQNLTILLAREKMLPETTSFSAN